MTTTYYSTDSDLVKIRPNILSLGVTAWTDQHLQAFSDINRVLIARWYKTVCPEYNVNWISTAFDPDRVDETQLVQLSCFRTLELAYTYLMQESTEPSGFERLADRFAVKYKTEFSEVLAIGVSYDWDLDDTIETEEKYRQPMRRLKRC